MIRTILLLLPLVAGTFGPYTVDDLGPMGRITQRIAADLTGNGKKELLVWHARRLSVYRIGPKGDYVLPEGATITAPADALYFDVGRVDGGKTGEQIVLTTRDGVVAYDDVNGKISAKPKTLVSAANLVPGGQEDNLHYRAFLRDLDGNGLPEILLPTSTGLLVYYQKQAGVWRKAPDVRIPYTLRCAFHAGEDDLEGQIEGTVAIPDVLTLDFDGDHRTDLALDDGRTLTIYRTGKDGLLEEKPWKTLDLSPLAGGSAQVPALNIHDVNGDGIPDFLLSHEKEGITDIFLGGSALQKPAESIKIAGWCRPPRIVDLNGDGRPDLVVPSTPDIGVTTALSAAVTGTLPVTAHVFLNTGDRAQPFPKSPDAEQEIPVRVRLTMDAMGRIHMGSTVLVDAGGDFNGDGRKDLVYLSDEKTIAVLPGEPDGSFSSSPAMTETIPDTGSCAGLSSWVDDLNGDGRPDLVIFYESATRRADRLVLLLSKGPVHK